jgi:hypothetical protein
LHATNVKRVVGEIISYHEGLFLSLFLVLVDCASIGLFLACPFGLPYDGSGHRSFIGFLWLLYNESKHNILLALVGKANKIDKEDILLLLLLL